MTIRTITHEGRTDTVSGWAKTINISNDAINQRLRRGWGEAEAVTTTATYRAPNKGKRMKAKTRAQSTPALTFPPYDELKRHHRQFNSLLRQFNRDLHALMGRGVGLVRFKNANDRTTPVARDLS